MKTLEAICLTLAIFLFTPTLDVPSAHAADQTIDAVIASVNGQPITLSDLEARIKTKKRVTLSDLSTNAELRKTLDQIISESLIEEEAKQRQLSVSKADIDEYINDIAAQNSLNLEDFKSALKKENISFEDYKTKVKYDILKTKIASVVYREGVPVTDEEVDAYIKQHGDLLKSGEKVKLRQIFISKSGKSEEIFNKSVKEVEEGLTDDTNFAELAKKYSDANDADEGGLIGVIALSDLSPVIQDAILLLDQEEASEEITTERGSYFFYVEEKVTGKSDAMRTDVRRMIENQKIQEKLNKYFALDLLKKHSVEKKV